MTETPEEAVSQTLGHASRHIDYDLANSATGKFYITVTEAMILFHRMYEKRLPIETYQKLRGTVWVKGVFGLD